MATLAEMEAQVARQLEEIEQRRIDADRRFAEERAQQEKVLADQRAEQDAYYKRKEEEFKRKKQEAEDAAKKQAREDEAKRLEKERENNAREEAERTQRERLKQLIERANEIEALEEHLRKQITNQATVSAPETSEMSAHLKRLMRMDGTENNGLDHQQNGLER